MTIEAIDVLLERMRLVDPNKLPGRYVSEHGLLDEAKRRKRNRVKRRMAKKRRR